MFDLLPKYNKKDEFFLINAFIQKQGFKIEKNILKDIMDYYPKVSSLYDISDILLDCEIYNIPIKIDREDLDEIPLPCLIETNEGDFMLLEKIEESSVTLSRNGSEKVLGLDSLFNIWNGNLIITNPNENAKNKYVKAILRIIRSQITLLKL